MLAWIFPQFDVASSIRHSQLEPKTADPSTPLSNFAGRPSSIFHFPSPPPSTGPDSALSHRSPPPAFHFPSPPSRKSVPVDQRAKMTLCSALSRVFRRASPPCSPPPKPATRKRNDMEVSSSRSTLLEKISMDFSN